MSYGYSGSGYYGKGPYTSSYTPTFGSSYSGGYTSSGSLYPSSSYSGRSGGAYSSYGGKSAYTPYSSFNPLSTSASTSYFNGLSNVGSSPRKLSQSASMTNIGAAFGASGSRSPRSTSPVRNATSSSSSVAVPERTYRSRFGSAGSIADGSTRSDTPGSRYSDRLSRTSSASSTTGLANDSDEKDYKKLHEEMKIENERLREKLRKTETELDDTKQQLEKIQNIQRNSSSDTEKREKRALERKLSEMEEELKQLEQLRVENQRLKDENGALIRVISKLSK